MLPWKKMRMTEYPKSILRAAVSFIKTRSEDGPRHLRKTLAPPRQPRQMAASQLEPAHHQASSPLKKENFLRVDVPPGSIRSSDYELTGNMQAHRRPNQSEPKDQVSLWCQGSVWFQYCESLWRLARMYEKCWLVRNGVQLEISAIWAPFEVG